MIVEKTLYFNAGELKCPNSLTEKIQMKQTSFALGKTNAIFIPFARFEICMIQSLMSSSLRMNRGINFT